MYPSNESELMTTTSGLPQATSFFHAPTPAVSGTADAPATKSAGHVIVDTLAAHGVERTYVVPGESFLDVLDGLHHSPIETIVCRHEGGAAYMAEAAGKMAQLPGIAMVTQIGRAHV